MCKPALRAGRNLVVTGEWSKKLVPWHKEGDLTDANIDIDPGRASTLSVKIDLSRGGTGAPVPSPSGMVYVKLQVDTAKDFLGESFGKGQILCVYRPAAAAGTQGSAEDYNDTVAHELGHMWNQTPEPRAQQPKSLKVIPCSTSATAERVLTAATPKYSLKEGLRSPARTPAPPSPKRPRQRKRTRSRARRVSSKGTKLP